MVTSRDNEEEMSVMDRMRFRDEEGMIIVGVPRLRWGGGMLMTHVTRRRDMGEIDRTNASSLLLVAPDGNHQGMTALNMVRVGASLVNEKTT